MFSSLRSGLGGGGGRGELVIRETCSGQQHGSCSLAALTLTHAYSIRTPCYHSLTFSLLECAQRTRLLKNSCANHRSSTSSLPARYILVCRHSCSYLYIAGNGLPEAPQRQIRGRRGGIQGNITVMFSGLKWLCHTRTLHLSEATIWHFTCVTAGLRRLAERRHAVLCRRSSSLSICLLPIHTFSV